MDEKQKKRDYRHQDQLQETDVGITEYLNDDLEGFSAVIKSRYSDFHVNEINVEGEIAKLTNTSIPQFETKLADYKDAEESPCEFITNGKWQELKNLVENDDCNVVSIDAENLDKNGRYEVHTTIKTYFGKKIVANTVTKDEKKFIEFKKYDKKDTDIDKRIMWPKELGEYVHFILYKEAIDTMYAISKIADAVRISASSFNYAGVKDRRAKTSQWISVRKVQPNKLTNISRIKQVKIGNITFKDKPLKLGDLNGNKFKIALRNVLADDKLIEKSVESVNKTGFINYYGMQRFGNDKEAPTCEIGRFLLLGNWEEAIKLILKPKASDNPFQPIPKAKKIYSETGDAKKAFNVVKREHKSVEVCLLKGLAKEHKNDLVNALEEIPRNMRLLYIHSFQSLVWNKMVSKRLKLFGTKPVVNDFVLISNEIVEENSEGEKAESECKQKVKALTEDDLPNYTMYDIVLPLPGHKVNYPENMKDFYKEELASQGLDLEMTPQKVKTYSVGGNYRHILCKVNISDYKIVYYNEPTDTLIQSDLEEMRNIQPQTYTTGKYKGLILEFDLPSSSYATMVLREILKSNTSSSAQTKLNNYHEPDGAQEEPQEALIKNSLFSDPKKYEAFKNIVFNDATAVKRKNDEDGSEESKKSKIDH